MNLLYLTFVDINNREMSGVIKKVKGQMKAFNMQLNNCYYSFIESETMVIRDSYGDKIKDIPRDKFLSNKIGKRKSYYNSLISFLIEMKIDYLYIRYNLSDPFFIYFLNSCKKLDIRVYIEIPTFPYVKEISKKLPKYIDWIFSRKLASLVERVCTFSEHKEIFGVPTIKIRNGIDINSIKVKNSYSESKEIHLIGVANLSKWHGYDRVIKGMAEYYNNEPPKKVVFHIIGEGQELTKLLQLKKELKLEEFVYFHGAKLGKELDSLFDQCHISVGSLGMHRIDLDIGFTLKLREYCARGIPFIYGYDDPDFREFKFCYQFQNNDNLLDINEVIEFSKSILEPNTNLKMRNFAKSNLTWEAQMSTVLKGIKNN